MLRVHLRTEKGPMTVDTPARSWDIDIHGVLHVDDGGKGMSFVLVNVLFWEWVE